MVKRMWGGVKKARLEFVRLTAGEESLVRIRLHTGRSHQIRNGDHSQTGAGFLRFQAKNSAHLLLQIN